MRGNIYAGANAVAPNAAAPLPVPPNATGSRKGATFCPAKRTARCLPLSFLLCLWGCLLLTGCAQRIRAEVSAVVEQGYEARGQSCTLEIMPGFTVEDPAAARAALEEALLPALHDLGYVTAAQGQQPDVTVRVWWFSSGPHPVYRTVEWRDRRYWHWRHGYRRQAVVVEDEYGRYLVVEGIRNAPNEPVAHGAGSEPVARSAGSEAGAHGAGSETVARSAGPEAEARSAGPEAEAQQAGGAETAAQPPAPAYRSVEEASRALPAAPARLVWRVRVESRGNLSKAERVLPELAVAAAPYLGKSALVHVLVQEGAVVASEAVAP